MDEPREDADPQTAALLERVAAALGEPKAGGWSSTTRSPPTDPSPPDMRVR